MHYLNSKLSNGIVSKYLLSSDGDIEWTKGEGPSLWPVLVALDRTGLHQIGQHHNTLRPLLPHHPPEVYYCIWQWTCVCNPNNDIRRWSIKKTYLELQKLLLPASLQQNTTRILLIQMCVQSLLLRNARCTQIGNKRTSI